MAVTLSIANISWSTGLPQFSTICLVLSGIGNTPVHTHTHTHTHMYIYIYIYTYHSLRLFLFLSNSISSSEALPDTLLLAFSYPLHRFVFPSFKKTEHLPHKKCSPATVIDMWSVRTSYTARQQKTRDLALSYSFVLFVHHLDWHAVPEIVLEKHSRVGYKSHLLRHAARLWKVSWGESIETTELHDQIITQILIPFAFCLLRQSEGCSQLHLGSVACLQFCFAALLHG